MTLEQERRRPARAWFVRAIAAMAAVAIVAGAARRPAAAAGSIGGTGVALTPAHFPHQAPGDIDQMFTLGKQVGQYAVFIYQWSQPDLVNVAKMMIARSQAAGLTPVVGLSPLELGDARSQYDAPAAVRAKQHGKLTFGDYDTRQSFIDAAVALAKLKPPYLCLATEIDMLAFADIKEYIRYAAVYKRLYPILKQISPTTKLFVSFQWDFYKIMDDREPNKIDEHTKLVDIFRPQLDLVAFTSYPSTQFKTPGAIPASYYAGIRRHTKPTDDIMFMEIGWPAANAAGEQAQAAFIKALPSLMTGVRPRMVLWSLLHDVGSALSADLSTTGLITNDGRRKPGFAAFAALNPR